MFVSVLAGRWATQQCLNAFDAALKMLFLRTSIFQPLTDIYLYLISPQLLEITLVFVHGPM